MSAVLHFMYVEHITQYICLSFAFAFAAAFGYDFVHALMFNAITVVSFGR